MKSYIPKDEEIQRKWYVVDGNGKVLGRLASEVAKIVFFSSFEFYLHFF